MNFGFRVDASYEIGSGHIMRCLTVASTLIELNHKCYFICRDHEGNLIEYIQERNIEVLALPKIEDTNFEFLNEYEKWLGIDQKNDALQTIEVLNKKKIKLDWMVIDHYGLSYIWENTIRTTSDNLLAIDDLANRHHDCDLILDCGLINTVEKYRSLNTRDVTVLLGPEYALLRPEFSRIRKITTSKRSQINSPIKILMNLGGVDKNNLTGKILNILSNSNFPYQFKLTIIMGVTAPWKDMVFKQADKSNLDIEILVNVSNMAEIMAEHDLAIGAAGSTSWERCCVGLPTIMICTADNQKMIAQSLQEIGATISLMQSDIETKLSHVLEEITIEKLFQMRSKSMQVCSGDGVNLLLEKILNMSNKK